MTTIAFISTTCLIILFALSKTLLPVFRIAMINRRLVRDGVEADAVLLNIEKTGLYINKQPQMKMQLQVHPVTGRNFVSETKEVVNLMDLHRLQIGGTLKVKYNPANIKEVMIVR